MDLIGRAVKRLDDIRINGTYGSKTKHQDAGWISDVTNLQSVASLVRDCCLINGCA